MLDDKRVAVVVPAHDEEKLIADTIRSIPQFVERVYVVDDGSRDDTVGAARALGDPRVAVIEHERNLGVVAAIRTGYPRAPGGPGEASAVSVWPSVEVPAHLSRSPFLRGVVGSWVMAPQT